MARKRRRQRDSAPRQGDQLADGFHVSGGLELRPAKVNAKGDRRIVMCSAFPASLANGRGKHTGQERSEFL